ncbi:interaptin isoform X2 [Drosophila innubila]|uniref:interaptin isoform X2 n=1 Tax=Drosophila innubila TaxID=198719 RepID=UPI00148D4392|nr:interaptin isoform X2 [Drosophila innubila]
MTQEANNYAFPSCAEEVAVYVEQLVRNTNEDLKNFRLEQTALHSHISTMLDDNQNMSSKLEKYQKMEISDDVEHLKQQLRLSNEALSKALSQIERFKVDRHCMEKIKECADRTIRNMETELQSYRTQLSKGDSQQLYDKSIKMLEHKLNVQQEKIQTQAKLIHVLQEHKKHSGEQIKDLQSELNERKQDMDNQEENNAKISSLNKQLKECSKSLQHTRAMLEKSTKREKMAMLKVQEAIEINEATQREKEDAEKLAETYKEEATQLATNIGNIMDEAAKRVDNEVEQLKTKLAKRDKTILSLREKFNHQMAEHKSVVQSLEDRYNRMTQKYEQTLKLNEKLEAHVESCNKRLINMEQCTFKEEEHPLNKNDSDPPLEYYVHAYKDMKSHYKSIVNDLTKRFEAEFESLQKEKCELQAENEILRSGPAGDGIGKFL